MTKTRTDKADSMNAARKTPARHANDFDATVADLLHRLGAVVSDRDERTNYHLAHVFETVTEQAAVGSRISARQRDSLLRAVCIVRAAVPALYPYDTMALRRGAPRGFDALEGLIMWWAENGARREQRHPHFIQDALAYAKVYLNDLRNGCLLTEVLLRFDERRAADGRTMKIASGTRKLIGAA